MAKWPGFTLYRPVAMKRDTAAPMAKQILSKKREFASIDGIIRQRKKTRNFGIGLYEVRGIL